MAVFLVYVESAPIADKVTYQLVTLAENFLPPTPLRIPNTGHTTALVVLAGGQAGVGDGHDGQAFSLPTCPRPPTTLAHSGQPSA